MNTIAQNRLRVFFAIIFFIMGSYSAYLAYDMKNIVHYGNIDTEVDFQTGFSQDSPTPIAGAGAGAGGGVDSSNDGVAMGLGIFAGFSMLASALSLGSLKPVTNTVKPLKEEGVKEQTSNSNQDVDNAV